MTVKLRIDLSQGILEVEGEEDFVREIHKEFQSYASKPPPGATSRAAPEKEEGEGEDSSEAVNTDQQQPLKKRKQARKQKTTVDGQASKNKAGSYQPAVLKELKLDGLKEYYQVYDPISHQEKVLIFGSYFKEEKNLPVFTANHLFTCYRVLNEKPPGAFLQVIRDTSAKKSWLNYVDTDNISVVHIGETYLAHDMRRKSDAK
ncbi:hypothetical protein [Mesorhizobium sp. LSJC264A00]|uniref:hypothetical protein n=1 Tax=unclassified Mesorhizobium TaxID=325217 RepID=UPI0003CE0203|nr:hypothetical protein [Mesorhizobium sp. LSJC264A00]ESX23024.1 hypothetical protein X767_16730 [Mesorhizobium sp. LSJC264A00]